MKEATLALIMKDGRLLLGVRKRDAEIGAATLNGPGGKIQAGESSLACMRREIEEEIGLKIQVTEEDHRAIIVFHNGRSSVWRVDVYLVLLSEGVPVATDELSPDGDWWYAPEDLPKIFQSRMLASDGLWMPKVLAGERFTAHVYQSDDATQLNRIIFKRRP